MKKNVPHWIRRTHLFKNDVYECSVCRVNAKKPVKRCPGCGSAMQGVEYDAGWMDEMAEFDAMFEE